MGVGKLGVAGRLAVVPLPDRAGCAGATNPYGRHRLNRLVVGGIPRPEPHVGGIQRPEPHVECLLAPVADWASFDEGVITFHTFTDGPYYWVSYELIDAVREVTGFQTS